MPTKGWQNSSCVFLLCSTKWDIVLCDFCGASGCHVECGGLTSSNSDWACAECASMTTGKAAGECFPSVYIVVCLDGPELCIFVPSK